MLMAERSREKWISSVTYERNVRQRLKNGSILNHREGIQVAAETIRRDENQLDFIHRRVDVDRKSLNSLHGWSNMAYTFGQESWGV